MKIMYEHEIGRWDEASKNRQHENDEVRLTRGCGRTTNKIWLGVEKVKAVQIESS